MLGSPDRANHGRGGGGHESRGVDVGCYDQQRRSPGGRVRPATCAHALYAECAYQLLEYADDWHRLVIALPSELAISPLGMYSAVSSLLQADITATLDIGAPVQQVQFNCFGNWLAVTDTSSVQLWRATLGAAGSWAMLSRITSRPSDLSTDALEGDADED